MIQNQLQNGARLKSRQQDLSPTVKIHFDRFNVGNRFFDNDVRPVADFCSPDWTGISAHASVRSTCVQYLVDKVDWNTQSLSDDESSQLHFRYVTAV